VLARGETIVRASREPRLWMGLALVGVSAVFWMSCRVVAVPLSVAYRSSGSRTSSSSRS
jgi:hypothetical protein